MRNTKKFWKILLPVFAGIFIIGGIIYMAFPFTNQVWLTSPISLARPNAVIERDLLRITPIGTSMDDVSSTLENNEWNYVRRTRGTFMVRNRVVNSFTDETVEIGTQSILVFLGHVALISRVAVHYAFDEDSKLIDITIVRYLDII